MASSSLSLRASLLVFPDSSSDQLSQLSEPKADNMHAGFEIQIYEPDIIILHSSGIPRGTKIDGLLHFPTISISSGCHNTTLPFNTTELSDGLDYANYDTIGFGPWDSEKCNTELLKVASSDRAPSIKGFVFYSKSNTTLPDSRSDQWSTTSFKAYDFPIYAVRGLEGLHIMDRYVEISQSNVALTDSQNNTGSGRVYVKIDNGRTPALPGLWLFLLIVLGALLIIVGLTSISMHVIQFRRRAQLRHRVASGEVDLEALGIKRLLVPRKFLDKIPLRTYVSTTSPSVPTTSLNAPTRILPSPDPPLPPPPTHSLVPAPHPIPKLPPNSKEYDQPSCSICLDDFTTQVTTVRELPCHHIFHPACIDSFLEAQSSLCPLCKKSVLPKGYVPPHLTHATVRRERTLRRREAQQRLRAERAANGQNPNLWTRLTGGRRRLSLSRNRDRPVELHRHGDIRRTSGSPRSPTPVHADEEARRTGRFRRWQRIVFPGFN